MAGELETVGEERGRRAATTRREVSMQMQEYIYLCTTPMYFLGASGRIVGGRIESPAAHSRRHSPPTTTAESSTLSNCSKRRLAVVGRHPHGCPPGPILQRFTSKLASVPRANRPASYGAIQFNFENKQPPVPPPLYTHLGRNRLSIYSENSVTHAWLHLSLLPPSHTFCYG